MENYYRFLVKAKENKKKFHLGIEKNFANFLLNDKNLEIIYSNHLGIYSLISVSHDKFEV